MVQIEELKKRIDRVLTECNEILKIFDNELRDLSKISFLQVKEIEKTIFRLKKQGLHVPDELKHVKLKLVDDFEKQKKLSSLLEYFSNGIRKLSTETKKGQISLKNKVGNARKHKIRKQPDYERPLGSKGFSNLEDYLIPVINLMNEGHDYKEAFHIIKDKLDVRYNTVSAQCTRALGLTTEEFVSQVKSGKIINTLEKKFPDKYNQIRNEIIKRKKILN